VRRGEKEGREDDGEGGDAVNFPRFDRSARLLREEGVWGESGGNFVYGVRVASLGTFCQYKSPSLPPFFRESSRVWRRMKATVGRLLYIYYPSPRSKGQRSAEEE